MWFKKKTKRLSWSRKCKSDKPSCKSRKQVNLQLKSRSKGSDCVTGSVLSPLSEPRHTSACRVTWYVVRVGCVLAFVVVGRGCLTWVPEKSGIRVTWLRPILHGLSGAVLPSSHLLQQSLVYRLTPEVPVFKGMPLGVSAPWPCDWLPC